MYTCNCLHAYVHRYFDEVINTGVFTFKVTYADLQELSAATNTEQKSAATLDTATEYAELLM